MVDSVTKKVNNQPDKSRAQPQISAKITLIAEEY